MFALPGYSTPCLTHTRWRGRGLWSTRSVRQNNSAGPGGSFRLRSVDKKTFSNLNAPGNNYVVHFKRCEHLIVILLNANAFTVVCIRACAHACTRTYIHMMYERVCVRACVRVSACVCVGFHYVKQSLSTVDSHNVVILHM